MKKLCILSLFFFLIHNPSFCAPARSSVKLELMHNLVQLTLQCLEHKDDATLFQKTVDTLYAIVTSIEYKSEEKEALIARINDLLKKISLKKSSDPIEWAKIAESFEKSGLKK